MQCLLLGVVCKAVVEVVQVWASGQCESRCMVAPCTAASPHHMPQASHLGQCQGDTNAIAHPACMHALDVTCLPFVCLQ